MTQDKRLKTNDSRQTTQDKRLKTNDSRQTLSTPVPYSNLLSSFAFPAGISFWTSFQTAVEPWAE